jgi:type IV secretory pathway VirB2 component (pilin)
MSLESGRSIISERVSFTYRSVLLVLMTDAVPFNWTAGAPPLTALGGYSPISQPMTSISNILLGARISLVTVALVVTYGATYMLVRVCK